MIGVYRTKVAESRIRGTGLKVEIEGSTHQGRNAKVR